MFGAGHSLGSTMSVQLISKVEAIKAMLKGKKVRHLFFSRNERVAIIEGNYVFEDGCECTRDEFWKCRTDEPWSKGWSIVEYEIMRKYIVHTDGTIEFLD